MRLQGLCRNTGSSFCYPLTTFARLGHTHRTADPLHPHTFSPPFQHFLCATYLTTELPFHHPLSHRKVWRTYLTMRLNPESRNYTLHPVHEIMKTKNLPGVITFVLWVSEWVSEWVEPYSHYYWDSDVTIQYDWWWHKYTALIKTWQSSVFALIAQKHALQPQEVRPNAQQNRSSAGG
jgi:hypothetical protein